MKLHDIVNVAIGAWGTGVVGAFAALLNSLRKPSSKAEIETARADLVEVAQEAAKSVIGDMRDELGRLRDRVDTLEGENETCRAENRQLWTYIGGLEQILRKAGIPIPKRDLSGTFTVIEGDHATVLKQDRKKS